MMPVEVSVEISKPVDEVFSYMTASTHAFAWRNTLLAITDTPPAAMGVGSTFHEQTKLLDQILETTYEVIEWIPCRRLTYKSIVGAAPSLVCLHFASTISGTRITMHVEQSLALIFPQEQSLAIRTVQRILQLDLLTLKEVLEND